MPTNAPIAIVIPCFQHAHILRRTLEGILNQTLLPSEVAVVDDGSKDGPLKVFQSLTQQFQLKQIRCKGVRFDENRGAQAARNEGARRTSAPFLLFLDADAECVPQALERMAGILTQDDSVDFVYSDFWWGNRLFHLQSFDWEKLKRRNFIHTSSLLRRSAFPGFDESIRKFQDWDLWLTMGRNGSKGKWIPEPLYRIEPRKEGMSQWLPKFLYRIPWSRIGWAPKEIRNAIEAERILRVKHNV